MKKTYSNNIVQAEQFTHSHKPDGIIYPTEEHIGGLIESKKAVALSGVVFVYVLPKPSQIDKEVADICKFPYPMTWIRIGDYIITNANGYSYVETQEYFERVYKQIKEV